MNCPILDQCLGAIFSQELEGGLTVEIIVVGRDDHACVRAFPQTIFIRTERPEIPSVARNIAISQSHGQLIASIDADCVADPHWIAEMIAAHRAHPEKAVIGGSIRIEAASIWALADNLSNFHAYLPTRPSAQYAMVPTCNISMRREAFAHVGMFDEALAVNEDTDWIMRARRLGYSLYFYPKALVWHRTQRNTFGVVMMHAMQWGYFSIMNRHRYAGILPLPFVLKRWWSLLAVSPVIALVVTAKVFVGNPGTWRYLRVAPVIFIAKWMWCIGAVRRLRQGFSFPADIKRE
ncbi:MAG: glycosyltransferase [Chitinivibrionales bacterium]|nr:glycosyltransferase [Chitinivibrionales bacterium]